MRLGARAALVCALLAAVPVVVVAIRGSEPPPVSGRTVLAAVEEDRETSLWPDRGEIENAASYSGPPVELGTRFTARRDGWVAGVRFYKIGAVGGDYTGSLWDSRGRRLARVAFGPTGAVGWQEARFATPVAVKANRVYTVSYRSRSGAFVGTRWARPVTSGPLSTLAYRSGVYTYGGGFPDRWNRRNYNYWVDVIFRWRSPGMPPPTATATPAPSAPSVTPTAASPTVVSPTPVEPTYSATVTVEPVPSLTPSTGPSATPTETATPTPGPTETTATPAPTVTGTATPAPTATVSTEPPPRGACPDHPTPACTGVPPGTRLKELPLSFYGDTYRVTQDNTVLDGVHIPGDLLITADNVVIRNSRIDGGVQDEYARKTYSFTITDSVVGPETGCLTAPGIQTANFTAERVHIRGHGDGFSVSGDNVRIEDSYVLLCSNPGDHGDGIQTIGAGKGLVVHHNTFDQRRAKDVTSPIFLVDTGTVDVEVTENLVMGGTYSMRLLHANGKQIMKGNSVVDKSWEYGPLVVDCARVDFSGNKLVRIDQNYRITSVVSPLNCT
ncbi:DUF4082 domain-containing protein [Planobispora takensis]|uniref:DUF4082 domain-containing protein n=1 Tax=Planobispora takensis TaxID=1367882 RepID=A0A8J3WW32_9ACTN|nr:DUF4082 domain-containing protein [Planobispora takensis]GII01492.1 hypothetical protein Pta02_35000 [Planobispora takensis]